MLCLNQVYYWRIIYKEHKYYRLIKTGKYTQKWLRPSREVWLSFRQIKSNEEIKSESRECSVEVILITNLNSLLYTEYEFIVLRVYLNPGVVFKKVLAIILPS